jgi:dynein heavy chain
MQSEPQKYESPKDFVRLWRHEMTKVVQDRLMTQEDRDLFNKEIVEVAVKKKFADLVESSMADPVLYGDFMNLKMGEDLGDQERLYEDCGD